MHEDLEAYFPCRADLNVWLNHFNITLWSRPIDAYREGRVQEVVDVAKNGKP